MQARSSHIVIYLYAGLLALCLNVLSWHDPFFWDSILTSTISQYFYEHGFGNFISPAIYDAGHPPLFYIYVTLFFKVFGRSLFAAHLSMLPLALLGVCSFVRLLQRLSFSLRQQFVGITLFFAIPAVSSQFTLVSYDATLLSFYLAALVAYLERRKMLFALLVILISGVSLRGPFCWVALSLSIALLSRDIKIWIRWNLLFLPAAFLISAWYIYHAEQTGWLFSTNNPGWRTQRGLADLIGIFRNLFAVARTFVDLGIFILSVLCCFYAIEKRRVESLLALALFPAMVFAFFFLPFRNPINHRYFLIVYVLMIPGVLKFLEGKKIIYSILTVLIVFLGNFQLYPKQISNGWDCTLVHRDYFSLKKMADEELKRRHIVKAQVGTVFPMNASACQTDLDNDSTRMINVNGEEIDTLHYILYSNIGNDFSDEQLIQLNRWKPCWSEHKGQVGIFLLQNPQLIP